MWQSILVCTHGKWVRGLGSVLIVFLLAVTKFLTKATKKVCTCARTYTHMHWVYKHIHPYPAFTQVLGIQTWVLVLAEQVSSPTEPSLQPYP